MELPVSASVGRSIRLRSGNGSLVSPDRTLCLIGAILDWAEIDQGILAGRLVVEPRRPTKLTAQKHRYGVIRAHRIVGCFFFATGQSFNQRWHTFTPASSNQYELREKYTRETHG